jgi:hypothetical protein
VQLQPFTRPTQLAEQLEHPPVETKMPLPDALSRPFIAINCLPRSMQRPRQYCLTCPE